MVEMVCPAPSLPPSLPPAPRNVRKHAPYTMLHNFAVLSWRKGTWKKKKV